MVFGIRFEVDDFAGVQRKQRTLAEIDPRPVAGKSRWGSTTPQRHVTSVGVWAGKWEERTRFQSATDAYISMATVDVDSSNIEMAVQDATNERAEGFNNILDLYLEYNETSATPAEIIGTYPAALGTAELLLDSQGRILANSVGSSPIYSVTGDRTEYVECFSNMLPSGDKIIAMDVYDQFVTGDYWGEGFLAGETHIVYIAQPTGGNLGDRYVGIFSFSTRRNDPFDQGCPLSFLTRNGGTLALPGAAVIAVACPSESIFGVRFVVGRQSEVELGIIEVVEVSLIDTGAFLGNEIPRVVARISAGADDDAPADFAPLAIDTTPGGITEDGDIYRAETTSYDEWDALSSEAVNERRRSLEQHQFGLVVEHGDGSAEFVVCPVGNANEYETFDDANNSEDIVRVSLPDIDVGKWTMVSGHTNTDDAIPFIIGGIIGVLLIGGGGAYSVQRRRSASGSSSNAEQVPMKAAKRTAPGDASSRGSKASRGSKRAASSRGSRRSNGSRKAAPAPSAEV